MEMFPHVLLVSLDMFDLGKQISNFQEVLYITTELNDQKEHIAQLQALIQFYVNKELIMI